MGFDEKFYNLLRHRNGLFVCHVSTLSGKSLADLWPPVLLGGLASFSHENEPSLKILPQLTPLFGLRSLLKKKSFLF